MLKRCRGVASPPRFKTAAQFGGRLGAGHDRLHRLPLPALPRPPKTEACRPQRPHHEQRPHRMANDRMPRPAHCPNRPGKGWLVVQKPGQIIRHLCRPLIAALGIPFQCLEHNRFEIDGDRSIALPEGSDIA